MWQHIKSWFDNFDIKPAKPQFVELLEECRFKLQSGNISASIKLAQQALRYYPTSYQFYELLGIAYAKTGQLKNSARAYKQALKLNPDLTRARHFLNATLKNNTSIAPRKYIEDLFNDYAEYFEDNLLYELDYKAHEQLIDFICELAPEKIHTVLDLGCGTGLLGQAAVDKLGPSKLVGVDLAVNMLAKSREKNIYTNLYNADLVEYLQSTEETYDLIAATDVLNYIGDLLPVFAQSHHRLSAGGYFGFSVEALDQGEYKLMTTGRYQHSQLYLKSLSIKVGFEKFYSKAIDLRKESGNIVAGYLVLLQK